MLRNHKCSVFLILLALSIQRVGALPQRSVQDNGFTVPEVMQPDFSYGLFSGFVRVDFKKIREQLFLHESKVAQFPEINQAYYWYHLALTNHGLRLPSDHVLPHLEQAIQLKSSLSEQQQFDMLFKAQQLSLTYGHYDVAIAYLEQIKLLYPPDYLKTFNIDVAKLSAAFGRIYYASSDYEKAEQYYAFVVDETEKRGLKPEEDWLKKLSFCQVVAKDHDLATETLEKLYKLYPTLKNEVLLKRHLVKLEKMEQE